MTVSDLGSGCAASEDRAADQRHEVLIDKREILIEAAVPRRPSFQACKGDGVLVAVLVQGRKQPRQSKGFVVDQESLRKEPPSAPTISQD